MLHYSCARKNMYPAQLSPFDFCHWRGGSKLSSPPPRIAPLVIFVFPFPSPFACFAPFVVGSSPLGGAEAGLDLVLQAT
jgi:hypothetical protein